MTIVESLSEAKRPLAIGFDESLFDAGVLDSFSLPALVVALEKAFNIKIPDADLVSQRFASVNQIADYVRSHS